MGFLSCLLLSRICCALRACGDDSAIGQGLQYISAGRERHPGDLLLHLFDSKPRCGNSIGPARREIHRSSGYGDTGSRVFSFRVAARRDGIPRPVAAGSRVRIRVYWRGVLGFSRLIRSALGNRHRNHAVLRNAGWHRRPDRCGKMDLRRSIGSAILDRHWCGRRGRGSGVDVDYAPGALRVACEGERRCSFDVQDRIFQSAVLSLRLGRRLLRGRLLCRFLSGDRHQHFLLAGRRLPRLLA